MSDDVKLLRQSDVLAVLHKKQALKTERVLIEAWGGEVEVRELSARERIEIGTMMTDGNNQIQLGNLGDVFLVAACYGLNLPKERLTDLDKHPEAVVVLGRKVMEMSAMMPDEENEVAVETAKND